MKEARPPSLCGHSSGPLEEAEECEAHMGRWIWGAVGIADGR